MGQNRLEWDTDKFVNAFQVAQRVKSPPAMLEMQGTQVQSLGWEDPLHWRQVLYPTELQGKVLSYVAGKSLQSCPTLCDPIDGSPPGSLVPVILQARTLECVAISFSNA